MVDNLEALMIIKKIIFSVYRNLIQNEDIFDFVDITL